MSLLILAVDDEPDVEVLFRQQFRRDLRAGRFTMEFAQSAAAALERITDAAELSLILILSDINMPGSGLELLPTAKAACPDIKSTRALVTVQTIPSARYSIFALVKSRARLRSTRSKPLAGWWGARLACRRERRCLLTYDTSNSRPPTAR